MQDSATAATERLANPGTGALVELAGPDELLAAAIDEAEQLELRLKAYRHTLGEELLRRMDRAASWTIHAGELTIRGET